MAVNLRKSVNEIQVKCLLSNAQKNKKIAHKYANIFNILNCRLIKITNNLQKLNPQIDFIHWRKSYLQAYKNIFRK